MTTIWKWRIGCGGLQKLILLVQILHLFYTSTEFINLLDVWWVKILCLIYHCNLVICRCYNNETKILTLHQERIVHLNGCKDGLCSYDKFKQVFATELQNCNFDEMCNID